MLELGQEDMEYLKGKDCSPNQKNNLQDSLRFGNGELIPLDVLKDICEGSKKFINEVLS